MALGHIFKPTKSSAMCSSLVGHQRKANKMNAKVELASLCCMWNISIIFKTGSGMLIQKV